MPNTKIRKVELFALHAIKNGQALDDYEELFETVLRVPAPDRKFKAGDRVYAVSSLRRSQGLVFLSAVEGAEGANPLIFNAARATERTEQLGPGEVVAEKTHAVIDVAARRAAVEFNQRGPRASGIAEVLEASGRRVRGWESLNVELNPIPDAGFVRAIDRFERIQEASIQVARPNLDWTDHRNQLMAIADESDARTAELVMKAPPKESLAKRRGIVGIIRDLSTVALSPFKGARVRGFRPGEKAPTAVTLARHTEHARIPVALDATGHVQDRDINSKLAEFLAAHRTPEDQP
jgi:hypothetical protein